MPYLFLTVNVRLGERDVQKIINKGEQKVNKLTRTLIADFINYDDKVITDQYNAKNIICSCV